ncbi:MAG: hypothetical protein V1721_08080 [Pseudomonadota bacterium]
MNEKSAFRGMEGEAYVAAILAAGGVLKIERRKYGMLHNGPNGEPSVQNFSSKNGKLIRVELREHGLLNDGPDGRPSVEEFSSRNGIRTRAEHRTDGKRNDTVNGVPAIQDFYSSGQPFYIAFCQDDKYNDSATGEAAIRVFDKGKLIRVASYKNGELVKELTAREIYDYLKSRKEQAAKGIKNVAPGLKR